MPDLDLLALSILTAAVLLFALYPIYVSPAFFQHLESIPPSTHLTLNKLLITALSLEFLLLVWVWIELPLRRRAEKVLQRVDSLQQVISRACERIVDLPPSELNVGLQRELGEIREKLRVDQVSWFKEKENAKEYVRQLIAGDSQDIAMQDDLSVCEIPWLEEVIARGQAVAIRKLNELPPQMQERKAIAERNGVKSFAIIPWCVGGAASALVLTSFSREVHWDKEVLTQLSVLTAVFASAQSRAAAQTDSQSNELRFRQLFNYCPVAIGLLDADGRMWMSNEAMDKFLGCSETEVGVKSLLESISAADIGQTWLDFREVIQGREKVVRQHRTFTRQDGTSRSGKVTLSTVASNGSSRGFLLCMIEDDTERVQAQRQIERGRKMLSLALDASQTTAWEYDLAKDTVTWLNQPRMNNGESSMPASESLSSVLARTHIEDRETLVTIATKVLQSGGEFSAEFRMMTDDGATRWMLSKGELAGKIGSANAKIVGVAVDITEIKSAQLEMQRLAKQLMVAQEEERKRLGRELHDDIGQRVALLGMELEMVRQALANEPALNARLMQLQHSAGELGTDLHRLAHGLHSSKLKHLGLVSALEELCEQMRLKKQLVELEASAQELALASLGEEETLALYRVAQEALNNIAKHSGASRATVALRRTESSVVLVITDNGQGFDTKASAGGIGLVGMRERLLAVNGTFTISSTLNVGTELRASVPLVKDSSGAAKGAAAGAHN
jgi:PAS domain S-box-containing protein